MARACVLASGSFIWRRIHSLMGLFLVLFLIEHLVTNSQAALLFGGRGGGFVRMVNFLHNLPHLVLVEVALIGVPLVLHMGLGVRYLMTARLNPGGAGGKRAALGRTAKNMGYTWMRYTAVIVAVGVVLHVIQFRFLRYPVSGELEEREVYFSRVTMDEGLIALGPKLGFEIYDGALKVLSVGRDQVIVATDNFGTAVLLSVRDVFKSPVQVVLYSIFVLATCFHAGQGLWTFTITWGMILKKVAQNRVYFLALAVAVVLAALGLVAIWGSYLEGL